MVKWLAAGDLAALLTNLEPHDVLFIDEIHRLNPVVEEILYPAMEDRALDIMIGEGPSARSVRIDLPKFTLVGATTRQGLLTTPLRDRFGIPVRLNFYTVEELESIVRRGAFISKGAVLMPSFVNIGARVDEGTMVDTWATVGSCAQIGKNVHLSGGVGIGGVGDSPWFVVGGHRCATTRCWCCNRSRCRYRAHRARPTAARQP